MNKRVLILVGLLCLTGIAYALVSANYDLSWHVIGGGGGAMESANYALRSTVGQVVGHSEYAAFYNATTGAEIANGTWNGY